MCKRLQWDRGTPRLLFMARRICVVGKREAGKTEDAS